MLYDSWSPVLTTSKILPRISTLLAEPDSKLYANRSSGWVHWVNRAKHDEIARLYTRTFAVPGGEKVDAAAAEAAEAAAKAAVAEAQATTASAKTSTKCICMSHAC